METRLIQSLKWTLFLCIAIAGTVAATEWHDMQFPHSYRGHVWSTRETGRWDRTARDVRKAYEFVFGCAEP